MSERITLELPEPLAASARTIARQTRRSLEAVLLEWLDRAATELPIEALSDEQVLALRDSELGVAEQAALSELLERQREGGLSPAERGQLDQLLALYRSGLVRKARALKVAVERGLEPPIGRA